MFGVEMPWYQLGALQHLTNLPKHFDGSMTSEERQRRACARTRSKHLNRMHVRTQRIKLMLLIGQLELKSDSIGRRLQQGVSKVLETRTLSHNSRKGPEPRP